MICLSVLPNKVVWFVGIDVEHVLPCRFDPLGRYGDESEQKTNNLPPKAVIFSDFFAYLCHAIDNFSCFILQQQGK